MVNKTTADEMTLNKMANEMTGGKIIEDDLTVKTMTTD
jgi:hypothetical protein